MLFLNVQGKKPKEIINELSKEYGCSENALWKDWNRKEQWAPLVSGIRDKESYLSGLLYEIARSKSEMWKLYLSHNNDNVRLGALKGITDINLRLMEMLGLSETKQSPNEIKLSWQDKPQVHVTSDWNNKEPGKTTEELLKEYESVLKKVTEQECESAVTAAQQQLPKD